MGTINTSMQAVQKAQIDLGEVDNLPPLGQDMVLYICTCYYKTQTHCVQTPNPNPPLLSTSFIEKFPLNTILRGLLLFFLGIKGLDPEQDGRVKT